MTKQTTGSRLKTIRNERNLTLKTVGKALNLDASTISKYENNARQIQHDTLKQFAAYYGVPLIELLGEEKQEPVEKTYQVQTPFIMGYTSQAVLLTLVAYLGLFVFAVTETPLALTLSIFFFFAILVHKAMKLFLSRQRAHKTFTLYRGEELFFEHPLSEKAIRKNRRLDLMFLMWVLFMTIMLNAFLMTTDLAFADQWILMTIFLFNFFTIGTLIVYTSLGKTNQKILVYDKTNKVLNTTKYRFFHILSSVSVVIYTLFYSFQREVYDSSFRLPILGMIFVYFLATQHFHYTKHVFYKQYRLYKR